MNCAPIDAWIDGQLALSLLSVDPGGLKGAHLRARSGPVRERFMQARPGLFANARRITPAISDLQLFGGVDLAGTLAKGRVVKSAGILEDHRPLVLSMAERCNSALSARLSQALDASPGPLLLLLDEGADPSETPPESLTERLAFRLDLDGLRAADLPDVALTPQQHAVARDHLTGVTTSDEDVAALCVAATRLGIASLRAPLFALRAARAHAALAGRDRVLPEDLTIASRLVLAHRATRLPDDAEDAPEDTPPPQDPAVETSDQPQREDSTRIPADMLVDAARALLPPELIAALTDPRLRRSGTGVNGAGIKHKGNRRGRPLPSRPGLPRGGQKIDLIATLRAAAPWQVLRRRAAPRRRGLIVQAGDIHIRRYQERSDRLVIFAVDASGSAAVARLAEVKGAIELMLADAYSSRDHVALVTFRGQGACLSLPPTRSLVQVKRRLAGLPGGGGTPLAAGLKAAAEVARQARGQGLTPSLALLTDGRANVPLDGRSGRVAAREDAEQMARHLRALDLPAAVVDTAMRPQPALRDLSVTLGGTYLPLPRADAGRLSRAIDRALEPA